MWGFSPSRHSFPVSYSFTEQRLGLLWRFWGTRESILNYTNNRVYYRLSKKGEIGNPDQRIADDIRTYCTTTLSFMLILVNASLTVIAFSGVMWTIKPAFVRRVRALRRSGNVHDNHLRPAPGPVELRPAGPKRPICAASLTYLRGNAESVAISRREGHLIQLSLKCLGDLAMNFRRIIAVNRNVGFFTTGYNWLIQIIPALIIAPLFIEGKVEFGVITQSGDWPFTQLLAAFSIIVNPIPVHFLLHRRACQAGGSGEARESAKAEEKPLLLPSPMRKSRWFIQV